MPQVVLNILCEGQTEDRFARSVLRDHLASFGIVVKTQILVTNKKNGIQGGVISYQQVKRDLVLIMKQVTKNKFDRHYFTTMLDLYALPNDFPGFYSVKIDSYAKVNNLETAFGEDINQNEFIPYIQLHEFEALVFCGLDYLLIDYPNMKKEVENLKGILSRYANNPEEINTTPQGAPSRRILKEFENKHSYNKPKIGEFITSKIGINELKNRCSHFKQWVDKLEKLK